MCYSVSYDHEFTKESNIQLSGVKTVSRSEKRTVSFIMQPQRLLRISGTMGGAAASCAPQEPPWAAQVAAGLDRDVETHDL